MISTLRSLDRGGGGTSPNYWEGCPECDEKTGPNESSGFVKYKGSKRSKNNEKGDKLHKKSRKLVHCQMTIRPDVGPIIYKTKSDRYKLIFFLKKEWFNKIELGKKYYQYSLIWGRRGGAFWYWFRMCKSADTQLGYLRNSKL